MHSFPVGLKLVTAGVQSIVVTSPFLATAGQWITVDPGPAARIGMTTVGSSAAGSTTQVNLAALDAFGNMGAVYTGTVHF